MNLEKYLSMLHKMAAADKDRQAKLKHRKQLSNNTESVDNFMNGA